MPPGQYTVVARATIGNGREGGPGGRGMAPAMPRPDGARRAARGRGAARAGPIRPGCGPARTSSVDGRNVSNVVLTASAGDVGVGPHRLRGHDPAAAGGSDAACACTLQPVITPGTSGEIVTPAAGRVDAEGRFTIASVVPGRYRLNASGAGEGWFLGSSAVEGQDSLDFPDRGQSPTRASPAPCVTFVDRQRRADRHDRQRAGAAGAGLQPHRLSRPTQRFWTPQSRRIQSTRPATDGRFSFRNLPAGEYRHRAGATTRSPARGSIRHSCSSSRTRRSACTIAEAKRKNRTCACRVAGELELTAERRERDCSSADLIYDDALKERLCVERVHGDSCRSFARLCVRRHACRPRELAGVARAARQRRQRREGPARSKWSTDGEHRVEAARCRAAAARRRSSGTITSSSTSRRR